MKRGQPMGMYRSAAGVTNGFVVFHGKLTDVQRQTVAGFARGEATLEGIGAMPAAT